MPPRPEPIQLSFQVPAPSAEPGRVRRLLGALEARLPGAELAWRAEVSGRIEATDAPQWAGNIKVVREADRDAWVASRLARAEDVLLYGGPDCPGLSVSVQPALDSRVQSGEQVGTVTVLLAPGTVSADALPGVLATAGDALEAWCCAFTPLAAMGLLLQVQLGPPGRVTPGQQRLFERLPALARLPRLRGAARSRPVAAAPPSVGWLNYWSEATARWLGFPDPARDGEWVARSTRTPAGAWVWRLTDEPLDPERPDHLDALVRAYQRFERIGA